MQVVCERCHVAVEMAKDVAHARIAEKKSLCQRCGGSLMFPRRELDPTVTPLREGSAAGTVVFLDPPRADVQATVDARIVEERFASETVRVRASSVLRLLKAALAFGLMFVLAMIVVGRTANWDEAVVASLDEARHKAGADSVIVIDTRESDPPFVPYIVVDRPEPTPQSFAVGLFKRSHVRSAVLSFASSMLLQARGVNGETMRRAILLADDAVPLASDPPDESRPEDPGIESHARREAQNLVLAIEGTLRSQLEAAAKDLDARHATQAAAIRAAAVGRGLVGVQRAMVLAYGARGASEVWLGAFEAGLAAIRQRTASFMHTRGQLTALSAGQKVHPFLDGLRQGAGVAVDAVDLDGTFSLATDHLVEYVARRVLRDVGSSAMASCAPDLAALLRTDGAWPEVASLVFGDVAVGATCAVGPAVIEESVLLALPESVEAPQSSSRLPSRGRATRATQVMNAYGFIEVTPSEHWHDVGRRLSAWLVGLPVPKRASFLRETMKEYVVGHEPRKSDVELGRRGAFRGPSAPASPFAHRLLAESGVAADIDTRLVDEKALILESMALLGDELAQAIGAVGLQDLQGFDERAVLRASGFRDVRPLSALLSQAPGRQAVAAVLKTHPDWRIVVEK